LGSQRAQRRTVEMQVAVLERQTGEMMRGQERFKRKRDELMEKYYE
jgi:hypothetical protein